MKWDVKLLSSGNLFYETIEAQSPEQAKAAALARNPHATIAGVNGRVNRDMHWNGTWEGESKETVHNDNHVTSNNNTNTGDVSGMLVLAAFIGGLWLLYVTFPFIGLGAGGYGGWKLGKKVSGTTLAIILSCVGGLGGFGLASAMIDSFNNGETTTEDVYVPAP
tara:strand:+ start:197 stop:688 length:492 start_codon:yes stop_codon:yes gene_type:complete